MPEISIEDMLGAGSGEVSIEDMLGEETSFESMIGAPAIAKAPTTEFPVVTKPEFAGLPEVSPLAGTPGEELGGIAGKMGIKLGVPEQVKANVTDILKGATKEVGLEAIATSELAMSLASGMILYLPSKAYGLMALPFGRDVAEIAEQEIAKMGYQPFTEKGRAAAELVGKGFEWFLSPAHNVGEMVSKLSPRLGYIAEFGAELAEFIMTGGVAGWAKGRLSARQYTKLIDAKKNIEEGAIRTREATVEGIPDEVMRKAQEKVLEVQKKQVELEAAEMAKAAVKQDLKVKGQEIRAIKQRVEIVPEAAYKVEPKPVEPGEVADYQVEEYIEERPIIDLDVERRNKIARDYPQVELPSVEDILDEGGILIEWDPSKPDIPMKIIRSPEERRAKLKVVEPIIEPDRQTGVDLPSLEGEGSPFFQNTQETIAFQKLLEEKPGIALEDVEVFTQKLINDANRWYHGDKSVDITKVRNGLSALATRGDELRMDFLTGVDHAQWLETASDAAEWARTLRSKIERREGPKLYGGLPLDEMGKAVIDACDRAIAAAKRDRAFKEFRPKLAAKLANEEFKRSVVDRSGNIRLDFLRKQSAEGYRLIQRMNLAKGADPRSANMLEQMRKEISSGLSRNEVRIRDDLVFYTRMVDIGGYKLPKDFNFPEGCTPTESAAWIELFPQRLGIAKEREAKIRRSADAYFEWMKRPLEEMEAEELISTQERIDLESHKYMKMKLAEIFDRRNIVKIGRRTRKVMDSGIEILAKGRETDILERDSEIMALETFNRAYGRIFNNRANRLLWDVAENDPRNPFVRIRRKGENIPQGWQRIFVYKDAQRQSMWISPEMAKEWITSNPEMTYKMGRVLKFISAAPLLRTFATGIEWGFAFANLPRDIAHIWYAARVFENGKWKGVYSPHLPTYPFQMGLDIARVFPDVLTKGPKFQAYMSRGGGQQLMVHQGMLFKRGRKLEGNLTKIEKALSKFGEVSELTTRLAIEDRVMRRRAREQGLSVEEARKNRDIMDEATFAAIDYLHFSQGGSMTKAIDNAVPYLNATIQATRGLWRVARENPATFAYKTAQICTATTLLYAAMRKYAPKTTEALQGSIDMQGNICIPVGDDRSFVDEKGQTRYWGFKVPLDPCQKFFKTFSEAAYDKLAGYEVDVDRITNNLLELSPVGVSSIPPTLAMSLEYWHNKNFWLEEDAWRGTDKPFPWTTVDEEGKWVGSSREFDKYTPEFLKDVGDVTRLSPERLKVGLGELVTENSTWTYLLGKGYDEMFKDVSKSKKQQHWQMILKDFPITGRFIFVTSPYAKHAADIEKDAAIVSLKRLNERTELDRLTEGYLFEKSIKREEISEYIRSFRDHRIEKRLQDRFDFQWAIRDLGTERSFWLRLQHLDPEVRARQYHDEETKSADRREQLFRERAIIGAAGGFFSDAFWDELNKVRRSEKVVE